MTSALRLTSRPFHAAVLLAIVAVSSPEAAAQLPDLIVSAVSLPAAAQSGGMMKVRWTVQNIGTGAATSDLLFDYVYLSPDSTLEVLTDELVGAFAHTATLAPGATENDSTEVYLQPGLNGTYFAFVLADGLSLLVESNESNNAGRSAPFAIFSTVADLEMLSVTAPPSASVASPITISYTVRNNGPDGLTDLFWYDQAFLSADTIADGNDFSLGARSLSQNLPAGNSYTEQIFGSVPTGIEGP